MFCGTETVDIVYQESKKRKDKANFIRKKKYFNNFSKNVKFNSVHNVIQKTLAVESE